MVDRFDDSYFKAHLPLINRVTSRLFEDVRVFNSKILDSYKDAQLIFVAPHRSMTDFILASYFFGNHEVGFPRVVGGSNLSLLFLTKSPCILIDFEKAGMISLLRGSSRFKSRLSNFGDVFGGVLNRGENVLFFPNGGRSYDGSQVVKPGLFRRVLESCRDDAFLVPVNNAYDFVVEAPRFEGSSSVKDVHRNRLRELFSVVRRLDDYFVPFVKQYLGEGNGNFAYVNFGDPVSVKGLSVDDLVGYSSDSFRDLTLVSCSEIVSLGLSRQGSFSYEDLVGSVGELLSVTPRSNMSCKLRFFCDSTGVLGDSRNVVDEGLRVLSYQSKKKDLCRDDFLVKYYSNSVKSFYNDFLRVLDQ